jgi:hypothetical protein
MKASELKNYLNKLNDLDKKFAALDLIKILANNFSHDIASDSIIYIFDEFKIKFNDTTETFEITEF